MKTYFMKAFSATQSMQRCNNLKISLVSFLFISLLPTQTCVVSGNPTWLSLSKSSGPEPDAGSDRSENDYRHAFRQYHAPAFVDLVIADRRSSLKGRGDILQEGFKKRFRPNIVEEQSVPEESVEGFEDIESQERFFPEPDDPLVLLKGTGETQQEKNASDIIQENFESPYIEESLDGTDEALDNVLVLGKVEDEVLGMKAVTFSVKNGTFTGHVSGHASLYKDGGVSLTNFNLTFDEVGDISSKVTATSNVDYDGTFEVVGSTENIKEVHAANSSRILLQTSVISKLLFVVIVVFILKSNCC